MNRIIVWALFDDGNMSVQKALKDNERYWVISIGINKNNKDVFYCDLSKQSCIEELSKLTKPDIIVASPPCESWSVASSIPNGNGCWITDTTSNLFNTNELLFIRKDNEYCKYDPEKMLYKRVMGELTAYQTLNIINHFKPKFFYIENPLLSLIWKYYKLYWSSTMFDIKWISNIAHYSSYDKKFSQKPTTFLSNIWLDLKKDHKIKTNNMQSIIGYDKRSSIPQELIKEIFDKFHPYFCLEHSEVKV